MKRNTKYLVGSLSILFVVCLGFVTVERVEGHGKPTGGKTKTLVSTTKDGCKKPSTTILKKKYKISQLYTHYGNNNPYPPTRQAPIPPHYHVSYTYSYQSVKKGHPNYSTDCNTCTWQWVTYLGDRLGSCDKDDAGCNNAYRRLTAHCQEERDGDDIVHYACKDVHECVPDP